MTTATPVASPRHMILVAALFVMLAGSGLVLHPASGRAAGPPPSRPNMALAYVSVIGIEWALVYWISQGLKTTGHRLRAVIAQRPAPFVRWSDLAAAAATWTAWIVIESAWNRWSQYEGARGLIAMLPGSPLEAAVWVMLSASAGFCEEVVFRGYLQRQIAAFTGRVPVAILLQALLFGVSHGYQGLGATVRIATYGAALGVVTWKRGTIVPAVIVHAWSDIIAGLAS